jgi:hypothetical protein
VPLPQGYGVAVGYGNSRAADLDRLGPVWYYDYSFRTADWPGHTHVLLTRPLDSASAQELQAAARTRPGHWWIIGNEPNDPSQDNLSPAAYAAYFARTAALIRQADPTAGIMSAGIGNADAGWSQQFVDATIAWTGTPPDLDAWNIHDYLLDTPNAYDTDEFAARISRFHAWMQRAGQGDRPLVLGEWGVLYGRGCCNRPIDPPQRGVTYLDQTAAWLEDSRLVSAWAWFTLNSGGYLFNGDLLAPENRATLSLFGQHYQAWAAKSGRR